MRRRSWRRWREEEEEEQAAEVHPREEERAERAPKLENEVRILEELRRLFEEVAAAEALAQ